MPCDYNVYGPETKFLWGAFDDNFLAALRQ